MNNIQVQKATNKIEIKYVVTRNAIPIPSIALWLDWESMRSPLTGKTYACSYTESIDFKKNEAIWN